MSTAGKDALLGELREVCETGVPYPGMGLYRTIAKYGMNLTLDDLKTIFSWKPKRSDYWFSVLTTLGVFLINLGNHVAKAYTKSKMTKKFGEIFDTQLNSGSNKADIFYASFVNGNVGEIATLDPELAKDKEGALAWFELTRKKGILDHEEVLRILSAESQVASTRQSLVFLRAINAAAPGLNGSLLTQILRLADKKGSQIKVRTILLLAVYLERNSMRRVFAIKFALAARNLGADPLYCACLKEYCEGNESRFIDARFEKELNLVKKWYQEWRRKKRL